MSSSPLDTGFRRYDGGGGGLAAGTCGFCLFLDAPDVGGEGDALLGVLPSFAASSQKGGVLAGAGGVRRGRVGGLEAARPSSTTRTRKLK